MKNKEISFMVGDSVINYKYNFMGFVIKQFDKDFDKEVVTIIITWHRSYDYSNNGEAHLEFCDTLLTCRLVLTEKLKSVWDT